MSGIIARIAGTLAGSEAGGAVIIDCGGIGYAVVVSDLDRTVIWQRGLGARCVFVTRHIIREDRQQLFGFLVDERDGTVEWAENGGMSGAELARSVFDAVCEVKNCGGAVAMKLLSRMPAPAAMAFLDGLGSVADGKALGKVTAEKLWGSRGLPSVSSQNRAQKPVSEKPIAFKRGYRPAVKS